MKKIALIAVAALLLSGCKKIAVCTGHLVDINGQDLGEQTVTIKQDGSMSKADYNSLVNTYEDRGYICDEETIL